MADDNPTSNPGEGPLKGLLVLDVSTVLAAPLTATLLSEFGAEVVKVELPGTGDPVRGYPPFEDGQSLMWHITNRNKKGITLDLHQPEGQNVFRDLVTQADVLITNFRPQRLQEWSIDFDRLITVSPRLVMLHISAFGRHGPYSNQPGFARVAEAFAGLANITGEPDRNPSFTGYPVVDGLAGVYGAFCVMLALEQRHRTGEGQLIDLALYEPLLRIMEDFIVMYGATGKSKERQGNTQPHVAPNDLFEASDGTLIILPVSTENMWRRLATLIGLTPEETDRYATNAGRLEHRDELNGRVARFAVAHRGDELVEMLQSAGVACARVNSAEDIVRDPHIAARGNLMRFLDPRLADGILMQAPVPQASGMQGGVHALGPDLGEHNDEVYRGLLGLSAVELELLRSRGVV